MDGPKTCVSEGKRVVSVTGIGRESESAEPLGGAEAIGNRPGFDAMFPAGPFVDESPHRLPNGKTIFVEDLSPKLRIACSDSGGACPSTGGNWKEISIGHSGENSGDDMGKVAHLSNGSIVFGGSRQRV